MNRRLATLLALGSLTLAGCEAFPYLPHYAAHARNSSSLADFLYPDGQVPAPSVEPPQLRIPLRVGLTFLPAANAQFAGLDETHQAQLLERIKQRFASRKFVADIVILPDYYLAGRRGYAGLEGVQRLYGLDVVALVSFDQETHQDRNEWSLAYTTIVGAFVVKGSRHDVSTLVDLAVVDPHSRQLIIRAGGTDVRHGNTTLVDEARETRAANITGFSAATDQMIEHFDAALSKFEADVRSGTAPVHIMSKNERTNGGGGGGALGAGFIGLLFLAVARRAASQR